MLDFESYALCVSYGIFDDREIFQHLQITRWETVAVYGNPARSVPGEMVILAGNDDPKVEAIRAKSYSHAPFHFLLDSQAAPRSTCG